MLVLALALGACGSTAGSTHRSTALEQAHVTLLQYTHDQVLRKLAIQIEAGSDRVRVDRVEVHTGGAFRGMDPMEATAEVAPGDRLDLRVPLGRPDCSVELTPDAVSVEFAVPGAGPVTVDDPAGAGFLADLHRAECAAHTAARELRIHWGDRWRRVGAGRSVLLRAPLVLGPAALGRARVTGVDGSVIFDLTLGSRPVLERGDSARIRVAFRPARCDEHVWQTSRGFQFELRVRTGGLPDEVLVPVVPHPRRQRQLTRMWTERCGIPR